MSARIAIIYYSTWGHAATLAKTAFKGAEAAGAKVEIFQVAETLPQEVLTKMYAAPKADHPVITADKLEEFDGFVFVIPTRYGRAPAQMSAFFDTTGKQWATGSLSGKMATTMVSTGGQHGGQETTALTTIPFFAHHGIAYVPLGYGGVPELNNMDEIMGGGPWGAGTMSKGDGSRQVSPIELTVAEKQGENFAKYVNQFVRGKTA